MSEVTNHQHEADGDLAPNGYEAGDCPDTKTERSPEQAVSQANPHERVGYRSPPKEHQFKKGQSGNPRGRPRNALNRYTVVIRTLNEAILVEAERLIIVREGDVSLVTSVQDAVMRSITAKAIAGDGFSAKLLLQMVARAEKEKAQERVSQFEALCLYKWDYEKEFARCDTNGLPRPEPLPHPDDVLVNPLTGEAKIVGPRTEEDKARFDRAVKCRDELIAFLEMSNHLAFAPPKLRRQIRARQFRDIERLNAALPPRLRRTYDGPIHPGR